MIEVKVTIIFPCIVGFPLRREGRYTSLFSAQWATLYVWTDVREVFASSCASRKQPFGSLTFAYSANGWSLLLSGIECVTQLHIAALQANTPRIICLMNIEVKSSTSLNNWRQGTCN
jgi:hypothetical protein